MGQSDALCYDYPQKGGHSGEKKSDAPCYQGASENGSKLERRLCNACYRLQIRTGTPDKRRARFTLCQDFHRMKKIFMNIIRFYQRYISPVKGRSCIYYPTCSEYTRVSIERFGVIKGSFLGIKRVLRCNPLFKGGYDPPPERVSRYGKE